MIDPRWSVEELLERCPGSREVLVRYGMWCPVCTLAGLETLADAARVYGIEVDRLVQEIQESCTGSAQGLSRRRKGRPAP